MSIIGSLKNLVVTKNPQKSLATEGESGSNEAGINGRNIGMSNKDMTVGTSLERVSAIGMTTVDLLLKTYEGKKIIKHIGKIYFRRYWWAFAFIGVFALIGIFALVKFTFSRKR